MVRYRPLTNASTALPIGCGPKICGGAATGTMWLRTTSLNRADVTDFAPAAVRVVVPPSVAPFGFVSATVTAVAPAVGLPKASDTRTVTAGEMIAPAMMSVGPCTKLTLDAAAADTVNEFEVTVKPASVAV